MRSHVYLPHRPRRRDCTWSNAALFAFRRTSSEATGHCPANSVGVYTGYFTSSTAGSQASLTAAGEAFYIAVM